MSYLLYICIFFNFIYFWLRWVFLAAHRHSSCGERGLLSSCSVWASVESGGYSLVAVCGLLVLMASLVAEHRLQGRQTSVLPALWLSSCDTGLAVLQYVESSQTRHQTRVPCTGRQILNPWTARKVPS